MAHTVELTLMDGTTRIVNDVDPSEPLIITGVDAEGEHSIKITDTSSPAITVETDFVGPAPKKR